MPWRVFLGDLSRLRASRLLDGLEEGVPCMHEPEPVEVDIGLGVELWASARLRFSHAAAAAPHCASQLSVAAESPHRQPWGLCIPGARRANR